MRNFISNMYTVTIVSTIVATLVLYHGFGIGRPVKNPNTDGVQEISTTTPNLLDIYKRAFSYEILADRQDFFRKYINSNIYGEGNVKEIIRVDDSQYALEISIGDHSIICPQEKTEGFERSYPLLKGKSVRFYGIFTYSAYFGYDNNKLLISQCSFERK